MVPSEFNIFGRKIKVEMVNNLLVTRGVLGEASPDECLIKLQAPGEILDTSEAPPVPRTVPDDLIEGTFWHEVVHVILWNIGEEKLYDDEKFVNSFSGCLHQITKTITPPPGKDAVSV